MELAFLPRCRDGNSPNGSVIANETIRGVHFKQGLCTWRFDGASDVKLKPEPRETDSRQWVTLRVHDTGGADSDASLLTDWKCALQVSHLF